MTDNLFAAGGDQDRQGDAFATLRPGLVYSYLARRMIHNFTGEGEVTTYVLHGGEPSLSGHAGWQGMFLPGPRSELTMSIDAGTGVLTSLSSRSSSDQTAAMVTPAGKVSVDQATVTEALSYISGEHSRVSESINARYSLTDDGAGNTTDTRDIAANLAFERNFFQDTFLLNLGASYLQLERSPIVGSSATENVVDRQLNPRATLQWRHDFNRVWSGVADGGVTLVHPLNDTSVDAMGNPTTARAWAPFSVYGAQLAYSEVWGRASVSARRNVAPNMFLAQNTLDDSVNVTLALPLPWLDDTRRNPKIAGIGSLGLNRTQVLSSETSEVQNEFEVAHVDFSLAYAPTFGQTYALRYEFAYQTGDGAAKMAIPAYFRNTLYFTFALRYPDRSAGDVPKRSPGVRSDREDQRPDGLEPIVPDPLEPERGVR